MTEKIGKKGNVLVRLLFCCIIFAFILGCEDKEYSSSVVFSRDSPSAVCKALSKTSSYNKKRKRHNAIICLSRNKVVGILEGYGFTCYDNDTIYYLREVLRENIMDNTIPESVVLND